MRCEILTEFSELQRVSTAWRTWVRRDARADVFQYWEYVGYLSSPCSDYNDILCAEHCSPAVLETALRAMLRDPADWTRRLFDCLPSESSMVRYLETLPQEFRSCRQLPTILLNNERAEVLKKLANKHQLKRYHHKLNKLGRVTFRHLETQEEARGRLDNFFHQHITHWAMVGTKSEFLSAEHRNFYRAMVDKLNPQAELRFGVLELDAKPIAYHFGFQINGKLTWCKPAFDVNYWDFCPGCVLLRCLFQYAEQLGLTEFDFSRGIEPYNYRYCDHVKHTCMLYIDRRPNHVASRAGQIGRRARESIRKRPSLARAITRIPVMPSLWYSRGSGTDLNETLLSGKAQRGRRRVSSGNAFPSHPLALVPAYSGVRSI